MCALPVCPGINRIRLEFKVKCASPATTSFPVLIESDWNLKSDIDTKVTNTLSINRIRLEFKVVSLI